MIRLDRVTITLKGGLKVCTAFVVLPKTLERYYATDILLLDVNLLRRGGVIQAFRQKTSSLYIRFPKRLCKKPSKRISGQVHNFWVRRPGDDGTPMLVLLDTGADGFYASKNTHAAITSGMEAAKVPQRVCLELRDGICVKAEQLEKVSQEAWNFVMGQDLLHKYRAVVDYYGHSVTFTVGGNHLKVNLKFQ